MAKKNPPTGLSVEQIIDRLSRAYEMEEAMSSRLVDLSCLEEPLADLSAETQSDIRKILDRIKEDTQRHKKYVMDILHEFSRREG